MDISSTSSATTINTKETNIPIQKASSGDTSFMDEMNKVSAEVNNEKEDVIIWEENYGFGYPLTEENYEKTKKDEDKISNKRLNKSNDKSANKPNKNSEINPINDNKLTSVNSDLSQSLMFAGEINITTVQNSNSVVADNAENPANIATISGTVGSILSNNPDKSLSNNVNSSIPETPVAPIETNRDTKNDNKILTNSINKSINETPVAPIEVNHDTKSDNKILTNNINKSINEIPVAPIEVNSDTKSDNKILTNNINKSINETPVAPIEVNHDTKSDNKILTNSINQSVSDTPISTNETNKNITISETVETVLSKNINKNSTAKTTNTIAETPVKVQDKKNSVKIDNKNATAIETATDILSKNIDKNVSNNTNTAVTKNINNNIIGKQNIKVTQNTNIYPENNTISTVSKTSNLEQITNENTILQDNVQTLIDANRQLASITMMADTAQIPSIDYSTVQMDMDDTQFFTELVQDTDKTIQNIVSELQNGSEQNIQEASKNVKVSATLMNALSDAVNNNKSFRIDFDKDISVVIKVDKDGALSAKFIPGDKAVEEYLKQNISVLRQRFDDQDLSYKDLSYSRQQQRQNQRRRNNKGE